MGNPMMMLRILDRYSSKVSSKVYGKFYSICYTEAVSYNENRYKKVCESTCQNRKRTQPVK